MNDNGALRLQLDVVVLQQNLKNIVIDPRRTTADEDRVVLGSGRAGDVGEGEEEEDDHEEEEEIVALPRSVKFLDWFLEGAERALEYAKAEKQAYAQQHSTTIDEPFTYDELKNLVQLSFSEVLKGPRGVENREHFMVTKKASADAMLRLNEIMWDSK